MEKFEINDDLKLIFFRPKEIFTLDSIKKYIQTVSIYKKDISDYKRFLDFSKIISSNFKYPELISMIESIKKIRISSSQPKACFYCKDKGIERLANLVVEKLKPEFTNNIASIDFEECTAYLELDAEVFKPYLK